MSTIVEFSDLKSVLDLEKDSFSDYPDLQLISDLVHADLENYAGRKLDYSGKLTETGFIQDSKKIDLFNLPVSSVSSVTIDDIEITDYTLNQFGLSLPCERSGQFSVTTKGGFKTITEDIYKAELSQIVYEYQNINNLGIKSFSNDGGTTTNPGFVILNHVKDLLAPYRHIKKLGF